MDDYGKSPQVKLEVNMKLHSHQESWIICGSTGPLYIPGMVPWFQVATYCRLFIAVSASTVRFFLRNCSTQSIAYAIKDSATTLYMKPHGTLLPKRRSNCMLFNIALPRPYIWNKERKYDRLPSKQASSRVCHARW